ncbi:MULTISPECIES: SDR family oxidoreductase [unclassified Nocardiopsis]|uniref:SDR family oxidoreductase n=1 Tax=Nocardiopsis TaxID=2013 RepID=UPI00387AAFAE
MAKILVTGSTGTLGRPVVEGLRRAGEQVCSLSRHARPGDPSAHAVDLRSGTGLAEALAGVDTVVHLAAASAADGDLRAAAHLIGRARRAGVGHVVYASDVGADRIPSRHHRTRYTVERALAASGLGWTVLRTTWFHDRAASLCAAAARLPVAPVPEIAAQPIAVHEAASRLVLLARGEPRGRVPDMGGPAVESFADLMDAYLNAHGLPRRTVPVRLPGRVFATHRAGEHLAPERAVGTVTFAEFLAHPHDPTV